MSQPVFDRSPRDRVRWACRCGYEFAAGPCKPGRNRPVVTRFFAVHAETPARPGDCLRACPRCSRPLPAISWQRFEDQHLAAAFGP